ncbi:23S rRNA pseudouridine1911/1915/1917 synthase [Lachnospiraceae bacterium XBB1006]|nr:23S rRNA pseudouridine1911/1915/1917 synthase [Lachnospiraceae bacterium XBB1006]
MLDIIYEDEAIMVCYKAAGVPTQTAKIGQMDMVSLAANYRKNKGEDTYVGLVQRLDQPVEGLMVLGKTKEATAALSEQVRERRVVKEYFAAVYGEAKEEETLTDYLIRDGRKNISRVGKEGEKDAKRSCLEYRKVAQVNDKSLVRVKLKTGRHHQIRVQLAHAGLPIVGDRKYGNANGEYMPLGLCSCYVEFSHPTHGERLSFSVKPRGKAFEVFDF